ncbi:hypothetical protein A3A67_01855 [Candidatus Peribacteria bacterium RIFCSPLOWO2_01_FULL_51_18]|nr:MAG: hypothetical protein A3C52_05275 [Candidatus Peribacteria bacterium RIFCSPHIGHO2_02_FULL_51_15]OGJ66323.1 MAG: hypothetical protein A3A67_01855 [Candidatus Peribacteria bacterium RIFCSPLOWO2_01_FULL_51_18]OGJ68526.1 MAG: hypothetical protein A3J34_05090 [Candidatus Peribacteria bacterium RIFCSPLOWO2_02_FULL_51_10]
MKKFITIATATLAAAALIPVSFAASRRMKAVQQIPGRPALERMSRRTLRNKTRQKESILMRRGTRGLPSPWEVKSSSSSSASSETSSASSLSSSASSAE